MIVYDLWYAWSDLEDDTRIDLYSSGSDLLELNTKMSDICRRYGGATVYTFGSTAKPNRKIITIEV